MRLATGLCVGFVAGYGAVRLRSAIRDRREPYPTIASPDPARYGAVRRTLLLIGAARAIASLASTAFVIAQPLERALAKLPAPLRTPAFIAMVVALGEIRELGVAYAEDHLLERTYGMSDRTASDWLREYGKSAALTVALSALLGSGAAAVIAAAPRRWPAIAVAATPLLLVLANVIAPTFILPMFNTFVPINGELEAKIRALATRYGAGDAAILRFDMSRQTKKANAFVTGVFGTKRIVLADTLIEHFPADETLFVVAHELGHYVRRDPWYSIAIGTSFAALTIGVANTLVRRNGGSLGSLSDGTRLWLYATIVSSFLTPLGAAISRSIERRADGFAIEATQDPRSGARAFRRLRERNLAEDQPPKWAELLFSTHPSLKSRIERLEAAI